MDLLGCLNSPQLPHPPALNAFSCGPLFRPPQWELVEGMDLLDYLNSRGGVLAEAEAAPLFAQLVHGIQLIHEAGLVHRGACLVCLEQCLVVTLRVGKALQACCKAVACAVHL